jgi:hypothetical protein
MKAQHGRTIALMFGLCLMMTLACQQAVDMVTESAQREATSEGPVEETVALDEPATAAAEELEISAEMLAQALARETVDERPEVLALLGRPDAFKMSLLDVEGHTVRHESWWYFGLGTQIDFVDGETVWTLEVSPAPPGSISPAWYDPLAFEPGMSAVAAIQLAAQASPAGLAPEIIDVSEGGQDLAGALILVGDQILLGILDDQVVYVETVPLFSEEGQS